MQLKNPNYKYKKPLELEATITKSVNLMKVNKNNSMEPKELTCVCFHCQEPFKVHYNRGIGMPSQKNYWNYWIDESWDYKQIRRKPENERGVKICDKSLKEIWLERKWEYLDQIKNKSRRQTLASYIYHKVI